MEVQPVNSVFTVMCLAWTATEPPTQTAPNARQRTTFTNLIHILVKTVMLHASSVMAQLPPTVLNVWLSIYSFLIRSAVLHNALKATTPTPIILFALTAILPA